MPKLKPWFHVIQPREDLRENRPVDASEFAVNLQDIHEGQAPIDYKDPKRFFERTYLTRNLKDLAAQTVRRLSGITVETSPVFNMATQFGGGKTHTLALLFHLARGGPKAHDWQGVASILDQAQVKSVPSAATAVFVGQKFDSLVGRGGTNGEPKRRTPWGEIAWQLGGAEGLLDRRPARRARNRPRRGCDSEIPARRTDAHPDGRAAQLPQPRTSQEIGPGCAALPLPSESLRGGAEDDRTLSSPSRFRPPSWR